MNDFDFFTGTWDIANRWRVDFLDPGSQWEEFRGVSHASRHFDGAANFDEISFSTKGICGLRLRLYNPGTGQWSIHWASRRTGTLFPLVTGAFKDGTGEFRSEDTCHDVPVLARIRWTGITRAPPTGNRPSPPTAATPGSTTGTCTPSGETESGKAWNDRRWRGIRLRCGRTGAGDPQLA